MEKKLPAISAFLQGLLYGQPAGNVGPGAVKKLAAQVRSVSNGYVGGDPVQLREDALPAYVQYYLPVNLVKLRPLLQEVVRICRPEWAGRTVAVLDLGCGPGTFLLGFLEFLSGEAWRSVGIPARVELTGVDRSADCLRKAEQLLWQYCASGPLAGTGVDWDARVEQICLPGAGAALSGKKRYELIIAGNVLTELSAEKTLHWFAAVIRRCLAPRGVVLLIDPGTRAAWRSLVRFRDRLLQTQGLHLLGPCPAAGACPALADEAAWCHEKLLWEPPAVVAAVDRCLGFSKGRGIKYSYFSFLAGKPASGWPGGPVGDRWRVVSYLIRSKGECRLMICNGSEKITLRRLNRNVNASNDDFTNATRGDRVFMSGGERRKNFYEIGRDCVFRIFPPGEAHPCGRES